MFSWWYRLLEIMFLATFVVLFTLFEILLATKYSVKVEFGGANITHFFGAFAGRIVLCFGMAIRYFLGVLTSLSLIILGVLYFYYRVITLFFPISRTLGPMLFRIHRMLSQDFVIFLKLMLPFFVRGFPFKFFCFLNFFDCPGCQHYRATVYNVSRSCHVCSYVAKRILPSILQYIYRTDDHRARLVSALKAVFVLELRRKVIRVVHDFSLPRCDKSYIYNDQGENLTAVSLPNAHCLAGHYSDASCPTVTWFSYGFTIQFMIILRLILLVILTAMFK